MKFNLMISNSAKWFVADHGHHCSLITMLTVAKAEDVTRLAYPINKPQFFTCEVALEALISRQPIIMICAQQRTYLLLWFYTTVSVHWLYMLGLLIVFVICGYSQRISVWFFEVSPGDTSTFICKCQKISGCIYFLWNTRLWPVLMPDYLYFKPFFRHRS